MKLIDIINGPWAILPEMLNEIQSIYLMHLRSEKLEKDVIAQLAAQNNVRKAGDGPSYQVENGAALIPVDGVLAKKMNLLQAISGGASTQLIERDIRAALADNAVKEIILLVDSPGGTVDGTFELTNFIYASRGIKPITTFSDGSMYSAAYAIGSAADSVFISSQAAGVGGIGVVAQHIDKTKAAEMKGYKVTEIYAGKYKRMVSEFRPLSDDGRQMMQENVDYLYTVFVNTVAKSRGVSPELVLERMSTDVRSSFMGDQAVRAGLVEGIATLDEVISMSKERRMAGVAMVALNNAAPEAGVAEGSTEAKEGMMDLKELQEKHPDLYQSVLDEGKKTGADAERERIKAVHGVGSTRQAKGHEELIEKMLFDGASTADQARSALFDAQEAKLAKHRQDFIDDGKNAQAAVIDGAGADAGKKKAAAQAAAGAGDELPVEERAKAAWDAEPKTRTEFSGDYEAFLAFYKANDAGLVKFRQKKEE